MNTQTQHKQILELLSDGKLHSTLEMRNELYVMQPATRIFELKERGHVILAEKKPCNPQDPNSTKIAWYRRCEITSPMQQELAI